LEKRRYPRRTKRLSVRFSDGNKEFTAVTSNVSRTGMFIRTRKPLPHGTSLDIVLEVSSHQKIALSGIVVRAIRTGLSDFKDGMGIQLTTVPQEYLDFIDGLA
jgi:Tfp pilus assembly protein PilZ